MSTSLKRLIKLFKKHNLDVSLDNSVYRIHKLENSTISAEILLPDNYALELKAVKQLAAFANVQHPMGGQVKQAVATPDFHAGSTVPVGAVVATSKDMIIPQAIGTDIHCGMRLHTIEIGISEWENKKRELVEKLRGDLLLGTRNLPMTTSSLRALFNEGLPGWVEDSEKIPMGDLIKTDFHQLQKELSHVFSNGYQKGKEKWAPEALVTSQREKIRDSALATIGGGNHFVEFQCIDEILDRQHAFNWGIKREQLCVMIHTGSRSVGMHVGNYW